ncbi:MAG: gamma-glutamylcyclotransferase [Hyphomicrobiaceae bacterium]
MSDLWVFGYGSLMWNPGFPYEEAQHAVMTGYHRALCVYSGEYRGTPERPGLVFGLDQGGSCEGVAFLVPAPSRPATLAYLAERELITGIYRLVHRNVALEDGSGRQVSAVCCIVERTHPQYAGRLRLADQARIVRSSRGRLGLDLDYVLSTHRHLVELGIRDRALDRLIGLIGTCYHLPSAEMAPRERARLTRLIALPTPGPVGRCKKPPRLPPGRLMRQSYRRRLGL